MTKRKHMTGTEFGEKLLKSVRQMKAGEISRVIVAKSTATMTEATRKRMGMSQVEFARLIGVSPRTLQDWEQGRREPSGAARTLLKIAAKRPDAVLEASK
ncbi:MAG: helix-turn-helix domain-containing protein [Burkholderiaceae bacterium]|jgi:putative transcriptional regulator|nr:helix-turn-helix domain-containing protein [Burkholderiaceae bacterium]